MLSASSGLATGWRAHEPVDFVARADLEARRLGATRPSDVTGLDILNVPTWQVFRPSALDVTGNITVLNGKGWTPAEARLGALMEAIERHWAETAQLPLRLARPTELRRENEPYLPLADVPLPEGIRDPGDELLAWVRATRLRGGWAWVPAHEVFCPYPLPDQAMNPRVWRSTGLASGSSMTEAIFHGLLEVLERDAHALADVGRLGRRVELEGVQHAPLDDVLARLAREDIVMEVTQMSALGGLHAFAVSLDDRGTKDALRLTGGTSAHVDPALALERALLEAIQTRATIIAGAREDLDLTQDIAELGYARARAEMDWWYDRNRPSVSAPGAPTDRPTDLAVVVRGIVDRLAKQGYCDVFVVPLSPEGAEVAVARVIVPGTSDLGERTVRLGRRVRRRGAKV